MNKAIKSLLVWVAIFVVFILLWRTVSPQQETLPVEDDATFFRDLEAGDIFWVTASPAGLTVLTQDGGAYTTPRELDGTLHQQLEERGIGVDWQQGEEDSSGMAALLTAGVVILLVLGLFVFFVRRTQKGTTNILTLRRSRARRIEQKGKVTFADVGGAAEAKERLADVIDYLKNPKRWQKAGVRLPRGVLLEGPPGCGKTLLARAVAGEAGVPFYLVSASEFVEMFVGVGAARVRDMFETAVKNAPAVVFIDELDAVGRRRGSGIGAGHDEREQTLNQLLVCIDGFEANDQVVVLAATNRTDVLDQALLRPGRFDCRVKIPEPDQDARLEILTIHTRNKKLASEVSLEELAERTAGWNGADLEGIANEAARFALRRLRSADEAEALISREDLERAMAPKKEERHRFDKLDAALIESATQLSRPTGRAVLRVELKDERALEGELVWADGAFLKISTEEGPVLVPKIEVRRIAALEGTEAASAEDVLPDQWARHMPDLA